MRCRWRRDRRGTTALEFALVGPVFIVMLLMVFEFGIQLAVDLALSYGAGAAARYAITGAVTGTSGSKGSNSTNDTTIRNLIVSSTGGLLNPNRVMVSATSYSNPLSYAAGSGKTSGSNGYAGSIVVYSISYTQPFLTGLPALVASGTKSITHQATVIVENEPY
ncbi:MAG: pilus assembly protein [Acetobacteraceae bacterium]|nr:pilus assembly protein [Acetobacteraceae bacterium]